MLSALQEKQKVVKYRAGTNCPAEGTACTRASRQETASTFKELEEAMWPEYRAGMSMEPNEAEDEWNETAQDLVGHLRILVIIQRAMGSCQSAPRRGLMCLNIHFESSSLLR